MTEAEWLTQNAHAIVRYMTRVPQCRPSDRKFRLAVCAACRCAFGNQVGATGDRALFEIVERFADGIANSWEWGNATNYYQRTHTTARASIALRFMLWNGRNTTEPFDVAVRSALAYAVDERGRADEVLPALVRCVFGNPFRPVALKPAWRASDVVALAQSMYNSRDFTAMPILADSLQDAGCEDEQVLSHCRDAGPHARGCWVVDGVLGLA